MKAFSKITILVAAMSLMACGKGFQNSNLSDVLSGGSDSGSSAQDVNTPALDSLNYKGVAATSNVGVSKGQTLLVMDTANQAVLIILPIPASLLTYFGSISSVFKDIPELPGAKIVPYNNDTQISVSIPLKYIVHKSQFHEGKDQLPSGDPLPAFPAGEGAGFAITIANAHQAYIYIGVSAAAVFVEMPEFAELNCSKIGIPVCPSMIGPFAIKNKANTATLGHFALIAAKPNYDGGIFVTSVFPDDLSRFIDDHIKY